MMMPQTPTPWALRELRACVAPARCSTWLAAFDAVDARDDVDPADRQPASGSLRLRALGDTLFDQVLHAVWDSSAGRTVRAWLGGEGVCLVAQCWLRQQHPPARRPLHRHPHQWHQDGALACRFPVASAPDVAAEALAPLVTVWIPLLPCGVDAPSLEWIAQPTPQLLQPAELGDAAVASRFGRASRRQARLAAGDALLFGPALLHRTHVGPAMRSRRVSVELRFAVAAQLPQRLLDEPLRRLP
jgi:hypothetical protein